MTRTAGAQIGCQRQSRFWGLGCPKIYHEAEDTLVAITWCGRSLKVRSPPGVRLSVFGSRSPGYSSQLCSFLLT
ncbi:hypothetical protein, partial [Thiolapillus sp.]|uniref:hypothetical protein n=1 Tax=Thiolapillus sp. TaxID=2017437 RepID=UPI003AF7F5A8